MAVKGKAHHSLAEVKRRFASPDTLEITRSAFNSARQIGFDLKDIVSVIQALQVTDFAKSETAHTPPNSRVWHDTYKLRWAGFRLYVKFAGETLIDLTLTSFKEL